jgi:hypothetical protein
MLFTFVFSAALLGVLAAVQIHDISLRAQDPFASRGGALVLALSGHDCSATATASCAGVWNCMAAACRLAQRPHTRYVALRFRDAAPAVCAAVLNSSFPISYIRFIRGDPCHAVAFAAAIASVEMHCAAAAIAFALIPWHRRRRQLLSTHCVCAPKMYIASFFFFFFFIVGLISPYVAASLFFFFF